MRGARVLAVCVQELSVRKAVVPPSVRLALRRLLLLAIIAFRDPGPAPAEAQWQVAVRWPAWTKMRGVFQRVAESFA